MDKMSELMRKPGAMKQLLLASLVILLIGCNPVEQTENKESSETLGEEVFNNNCVVCHGSQGRGLVSNWKVKGADGNYPAPPLNGTAHTWHHSPSQLLYTINEGGIKIGGQMPAFAKRLSEDEKQAVLDYIYSLWPNEIQTKYNKRFK
jgi:mono/diheme cytochrome c family protein